MMISKCTYALTSAIQKNEVTTSKQVARPFQSMGMFIIREANIFSKPPHEGYLVIYQIFGLFN
jgi:hypothetical protein